MCWHPVTIKLLFLKQSRGQPLKSSAYSKCIFFMGSFLWIFFVSIASCYVESLPYRANGFTILYHCRKHHSDISYTIRNIYTYICSFWISGEILCLVQCCCIFAVVERDREFLKRNYAQERISLPQMKWNHNPTSLLRMLGICPVFFHCLQFINCKGHQESFPGLC